MQSQIPVPYRFDRPRMTMNSTQTSAQAAAFELRFESLSNAGRGFVFPCDAGGHVNLDSLSERGRNSYLGARALVGREYATPVVRVASH
jgi:hypothetical protein